MEPFGWIAVAASLAVACYVTVARRKRLAATILQVSKLLHLTFVNEGRGRVRGSYRGFDVDLRVETRADNDNTTYVLHHRLYARDKIPTDVRLVSSADLGRGSTAEVLATMDADFDRCFSVAGRRLEALAVLDAATRRALIARLRDVSLLVAAGALVAVRERADRDGVSEIVRRFERLVELAERLSVPRDQLFDRVAHNAIADPLWAVRAENLDCACGERPGTDAVIDLCRRALDDSHPRVRFIAACHLEGEGTVVLRELALNPKERALDPSEARFEDGVPADVAADAVKALATRISGPELAAVLQSVLQSGRYALAKEQALEIVRARKVALPAALVVAVLEASDEVPAEVVLRALVAIGDGSVTARIASLLPDLRPEDQVAACRALRVIGTVEAVEALRELTRGVLRDREVGAAAEQAIAAIQLRARGEVGRLSVIDGADAGGLALAEGGALAVVDGKDDP
ncbi:MAG: hypothetical protein RIT81_39420 [Deltaproteobacteria bacterium]